MTRIGIIGSEGRMGQAIAEAIAEPAMLAGGVDTEGDVRALAGQSDVLVDFSAAAALVGTLGAAVAAGVPILVGTTGLNDDHQRDLDDASRHVAVLQTGNTSLGVTLLAALVREAAAKLGTDWDIEILETHHRHKVDAPSGTARLLADAAARPLAPLDRNGARPPGTTGFASLRGGSVAGDHLVIFAGEGERLELGHRAETRAIFARGAIRAALWLAGRPPGRYRMQDVLGL